VSRALGVKPETIPGAKVVNWRRGHRYDVRITRGTPYGNPYVIGRDGNRKQVLAAHRRHLALQLAPGGSGLHILLDALRGQVLGCVCWPNDCHGDLLAELAEMDRGAREQWARRYLEEQQ
jgi:hypothetical protein